MENRHLFRAKRIDNGEWIFGNLIQTDNGAYIIQNYIPQNLLNKYKVMPFTVCQCTGLKDKNGKLIFENDILMCHGNTEDLVKAVFGEFNIINAETLEAVDRVIGWHYEVVPTDALSKCEPFCLPMPLTEVYVKKCEMEIVERSSHDGE